MYTIQIRSTICEDREQRTPRDFTLKFCELTQANCILYQFTIVYIPKCLHKQSQLYTIPFHYSIHTRERMYTISLR